MYFLHVRTRHDGAHVCDARRRAAHGVGKRLLTSTQRGWGSHATRAGEIGLRVEERVAERVVTFDAPRGDACVRAEAWASLS